MLVSLYNYRINSKRNKRGFIKIGNYNLVNVILEYFVNLNIFCKN